MSNFIHLTKEEVFDYTEDGELVKTSSAKYGALETYVFQKDNKHYMISVDAHHSEGWQLLKNKNVAYEVVPVEKTVIEWVKVK